MEKFGSIRLIDTEVSPQAQNVHVCLLLRFVSIVCHALLNMTINSPKRWPLSPGTEIVIIRFACSQAPEQGKVMSKARSS